MRQHHSRREFQSPSAGLTIGLAIFGIFLAYCVAKWSEMGEIAAPKIQPVKVPKARTTPAVDTGSQWQDAPAGAGPVVLWLDPCDQRPNDTNWSFVEDTDSCEFALSLLLHEPRALGVYETMLQFGQRDTAPIATMSGHCRRFYVPLLRDVSYLENFGYANAMSRQLIGLALRCKANLDRKFALRIEPDRDDASMMLVEADIKSISSPY